MAINHPGEEPKSLGQQIRSNYHKVELIEIVVLSVIGGGLLVLLLLLGIFNSTLQ